MIMKIGMFSKVFLDHVDFVSDKSFMSLCLPPTGSGDILFFPVRPSVRPSVCLSVTNRVRSIT